MVWLSLPGFAVRPGYRGWPWALGFFVGATVSALNFRWLHGLVDAFSPGPAKPKEELHHVPAPLRYVLFSGSAML